LKREKIGLVYKGKKIFVEDIKRVSELGKFRGLMFRFSKEKSPALLFVFSKPSKMKIHSLFVFFPFLGVWLDKNNNVLEIRKIKSWKISISPGKEFYKLLEIPLNKKYRRGVVLLDESQKDL
jgi:uncharacterized membrane protein (UPF0127 family)